MLLSTRQLTSTQEPCRVLALAAQAASAASAVGDLARSAQDIFHIIGYQSIWEPAMPTQGILAAQPRIEGARDYCTRPRNLNRQAVRRLQATRQSHICWDPHVTDM